jgi:phosphoglucosamine mutase
MVDEAGEVIDGDKLMAVLAVHLHRIGKLRGGGMVATVMSNQALEDYLASQGLKLYRSAVGDKNVVEMMQEKGINFGGEQSGHIIFSDYAKTGDGISSALQALACLVSSGEKASVVFNPFDTYPQLLVNLEVVEKIPLERVAGLEALQEEITQAGMRHLFRYSGTENKIRLLLEGRDAQVLDAMMERVAAFFSEALS